MALQLEEAVTILHVEDEAATIPRQEEEDPEEMSWRPQGQGPILQFQGVNRDLELWGIQEIVGMIVN